jgi:stearoyl-CoA desaturase (delta-9 desaturase)
MRQHTRSPNAVIREDERIDLRVCWPLLAVHTGALLVLWAGWSPEALLTALFLFVLRAFGLTAGYHRYFAHRSFRTSRAFQFVLAWLAASAAQLRAGR